MSSINHEVSLFEFVGVLCNPPDHRSRKDLNNLTVTERQKVFQDLAGSSVVEEEDIATLLVAIHKFNEHMTTISTKPAYELALQQNSTYVLDPGFVLMFLRANEYDPQRSAEMVVAHFEEKLVLFGEDKLTKTIELSDLSDDDMDSLRSGGVQIGSSKDKAGRIIVFFRKEDYRWKTIENWLRAFWYIWMAILQDEDVQLRGIVTVAFEIGAPMPKYDYELIRRELRMQRCIPMRIVGSHFCAGNQVYMQALNLVLYMGTPFFRVRTRAHFGIETEILYQLMTFGIPPSAVPWVAGGSKHHERWLEERQWIETPSRFMDMDLDDQSDGDDDGDNVDHDDWDDHTDCDTKDN